VIFPEQCRYSPHVRRIFDLYWNLSLKRKLGGIYFRGKPTGELPPAGPLVFVANHCSWWDGFLLLALQKKRYPDHAIYTVMLETSFPATPRFFRWLGAIPITPGNLSSHLQLFRYLAAKKKFHREKMIVVYFPQGQIWPSTRRPLGFKRGALRLAKYLGAVCLPIGIHAEMRSEKFVTFFLAEGDPVRAEDLETPVQILLDETAASLSQNAEFETGYWQRW
jgi:1-acyl-sn-glycerol-3-phosphate acyltransferase